MHMRNVYVYAQLCVVCIMYRYIFSSKLATVTPQRRAQQPPQLRNQHFVLKTPIQPPFPAGLQTVVLGTDCFWGSEKMFWKLPGVYSTAVGYAAAQGRP